MNSFFTEFFGNKILWSAFCGYFTAQVIKCIIEAIMDHTFSLGRLFSGNGGMPSSHSATVCALATMTGIVKGVGTFEFAMTVVFAIVVMTAASGVRRETGNQAIAINELMEYFEKLKSDLPKPHFSQDQLKELIGHTPLQVQLGGVLGIVVALILNALW